MPFLAAIPAATAIGAATQAVGGIAGAAAAGAQRGSAEQQQAAAIQQLQAVGVPSVEAQKIVLQNPEYVAQWANQQETAEQQGPSAMEGVSTDPRLGLAQMQALERMQQLGSESFTPEEQAQLKGMQRENAQRGAANQATILQNMAQRGAGGSGLELASRMAAAQNQAQNEAEAGDRLSAEAHSRALQAMMNAGELGGKVREQEFGEKSNVAKAQDAIANFNALQRAGTQQRNVGTANSTAEAQARMRQDIENQRADLANRQEMHNKELQQTQFANQMAKAQALQQPMQKQASQTAAGAAATGEGIAKTFGGIGSAIAGMAKTDAGDAGVSAEDQSTYEAMRSPEQAARDKAAGKK